MRWACRPGRPRTGDRFGLGLAQVWTLAANTALFWRHERIELPVADGADDVALAFAADAWSRLTAPRPWQ